MKIKNKLVLMFIILFIVAVLKQIQVEEYMNEMKGIDNQSIERVNHMPYSLYKILYSLNYYQINRWAGLYIDSTVLGKQHSRNKEFDSYFAYCFISEKDKINLFNNFINNSEFCRRHPLFCNEQRNEFNNITCPSTH